MSNPEAPVVYIIGSGEYLSAVERCMEEMASQVIITDDITPVLGIDLISPRRYYVAMPEYYRRLINPKSKPFCPVSTIKRYLFHKTIHHVRRFNPTNDRKINKRKTYLRKL